VLCDYLSAVAVNVPSEAMLQKLEDNAKKCDRLLTR